MDLFAKTVQKIKEPDKEIMNKTRMHIDNLVKPIGSLGTLEEIAIKISGITGKVHNELNKKAVILMASDNGIYEEGVSCSPQEVTAIQTLNFTKGITGINVLSDIEKNDLFIVDIGIKSNIKSSKIINKKIRYGTSNFAKGSAMSRDEAIKSIEIGIEIAEDLINKGYNILGTGEMGIGNTSTSSAIVMAFMECKSSAAVGRGAGLTKEGYINKVKAIEKGLKINMPEKDDPIDVLSKVGGFEIGGLAGCYLAAAANNTPIVIDGFISAAAALVSYKINRLTKEYMISSHCSREPGYSLILENIGLEPMLNLNMRLGEGTGCPLAFNIIENALAITNKMATFEQAQIDSDKLIDIRDEN